MKASNNFGSVLILILLVISMIVIIPHEVDCDGSGILNTFYSWEGRGGYVACGNGTWGTSSGTIVIQGIPPGATIERAYLYWMDWSGDGIDNEIYLNGNSIIGFQIGSEGNWYSFRANVTGNVTGNGDYIITDTEAYGLSIVAVYSDPSSDNVIVIINDGMDSNWGESLPHWLTETAFSGFVVSENPKASISYIMGDGQIYFQGDWRYDKYSFNDNIIAVDEADGSDGNPYSHGWDTDTYNVSDYVMGGETSANATVYEDNDELGWVTGVFSVTVVIAENVPPIADAGSDQVVFEGDAVYFDASNSSDQDGIVKIYEWDFDAADGLWWEVSEPPDSTNSSAFCTYGDMGVYTVTLKVIDDNGFFDVDICEITVLPNPNLYINTSLDGRDVVLYWDTCPLPGLDHYHLYRSTSQLGFDFATIWVNTAVDIEPAESVIVPLRTTWNDTNASDPLDSNYKQEYYYTLRSVNIKGGISRTSRTVGKWSRTFSKGISSFSLPLKPIDSFKIDYCVSSMNVEYIKYMDPSTHKWVQHNYSEGEKNNIYLEPGEGYEVRFSNQSNYTFTGLPGAMIVYDDDTGYNGFSNRTEATSVNISINDSGDVNITWQESMCMESGDWCEIYYSNTRDGFFGDLGVDYYLVCSSVNYGSNTAVHIGTHANDPGTRLYYLVVPFNKTGISGSSTYSIGIWTEEYTEQYDTFGIPLKLENNQSADWYCDHINNTVGINFFDHGNQRWEWHPTHMPSGAFDPIIEMTEGYQISTSNGTDFTFIGI